MIYNNILCPLCSAVESYRNRSSCFLSGNGKALLEFVVVSSLPPFPKHCVFKEKKKKKSRFLISPLKGNPINSDVQVALNLFCQQNWTKDLCAQKEGCDSGLAQRWACLLKGGLMLSEDQNKLI